MIKYSRQIIASVCIIIITVRLIFPKLNFDIISLTLLGIAVLAIIIPQPDKLFKRTKRIKLGGFELELEELNKSTEKLEEKIQEQEPKSPRISGFENSMDFEFKFSDDLHTDTLKISIDIEKTLREIYEMALKTKQNRPLAVSELIETLREKKIIDLELTKLLRQFWIFRNNIVHSISYVVTKQEFLSFADIGLRVLKILKTIQNNISDGTVIIKVLS